MSDKDLVDAFYLLNSVEGALTEASTGTAAWWRGEAAHRRLTGATSEFARAAEHLAEAEVPISDALRDGAVAWSADRPSAAELQSDRDRVLKLIGVVEYLIAERGLDGPPRSDLFSEGSSDRWDRVRNQRGSIKKNHNAG